MNYEKKIHINKNFYTKYKVARDLTYYLIN